MKSIRNRKKRTTLRLGAVLLAAFLLAAGVLALFPAAALQIHTDEIKDDTAQINVSKVIGVVYDNSGSMDGDRQRYAEYAMKSLIAMMNPTDEMYITPMNALDSDDKYNRPFAVDLTGTDRQAQLDKLFSSSRRWYTAAKGTPFSAVRDTVALLQEKQRQSDAVNEEKEYWLVILTDGYFDDVGYNDLGMEIRKFFDPSCMHDLHIVYFGMGVPAEGALSASERAVRRAMEAMKALKAELPSSGLTNYEIPATDPSALPAVMQQIANQLTGRFFVNDGVTLGADGKTVSVKIGGEGFDYAVRRLSVLLQDSANRITSAVFTAEEGGSSMDLQVRRPCVVSPHKDIASAIKGLYSAVVETESGGIKNGTLTLSFTSAVKLADLTVLAEPALQLNMRVEYPDEDGGWTDKSETGKAPSALLSMSEAGTKVRVSYSLCEEGDGGRKLTKEQIAELKNADVVFSYTYGTETKQFRNDVPDAACSFITPCGDGIFEVELKQGANTFSYVIKNENGSTYELKSSLSAVVGNEQDINGLHIEGNYRLSKSGETDVANVTFRIKDDGKYLTKADLENDYILSFSMLTPKGENGNLSFTVDAQGQIAYEVPYTKQGYGTWDLTLKARSKDGRYTENTVGVPYYPSAIALTAETPVVTEKPYGLRTAAESFVFSCVAGSELIPLTGSGLDITVTVDDKKLAARYYATDGNKLTVTPTAEALEAIGVPVEEGKAASYAVSATVSVRFAGSGSSSPVSGSASATLQIEPSVYAITSETSGGNRIDRFHLNESATEVRFRVTRDGTMMTAAELQEALDAGWLKPDTTFPGFLSPLQMTASAEEDAAGGMIVCRFGTGNTFFDYVLTGMFLKKSGDVRVDVFGANASETVNAYADCGWGSYAIRIFLWAVFFYLIYCIICALIQWRFGQRKWKYRLIPRGTLVHVSAGPRGKVYSADARLYRMPNAKITFRAILRFFSPWISGQQEIKMSVDGEITLCAHPQQLKKVKLIKSYSRKEGVKAMRPFGEALQDNVPPELQDVEDSIRKKVQAGSFHGQDWSNLPAYTGAIWGAANDESEYNAGTSAPEDMVKEVLGNNSLSAALRFVTMKGSQIASINLYYFIPKQ